MKNPPANAGDTRDAGSVPRSGNPLEEETATHSSFLAWEIPWTEEPGGLRFRGSQSDTTWKLNNNNEIYEGEGQGRQRGKDMDI